MINNILYLCVPLFWGTQNVFLPKSVIRISLGRTTQRNPNDRFGIKNESQEVKNWILEQTKRDCQMVEYDKGGGRRLMVGYTDDRAKKDAYNREKGICSLGKGLQAWRAYER